MDLKKLSTLYLPHELIVHKFREYVADNKARAIIMQLTIRLFCNGLNRWFLPWLRAHNAQEVSVVKYVVVYGQIKAADQKYRQTIFGRDIVEQWSRI